MLLAGKVVSTSILLLLLAAGVSGPRSSPSPATAIGDEGVPAAAPENDVKRTQQALHDKKHYRGKVDGSFGLRTRAGIRAYQKAESLPITGQIDTQTAAVLGVRPESTSNNVQGGREVSHKEKPSAGTARVASRASKARRKDIAEDRSAFGVGNNRDKGANR
ncbi:MAG TPA: peptidoglycan-binding domain-containing protein [Terriglobales bacterium]|nr:peptidoglycan-binding domain-containing protein [Terriglobales bacterium]